MVARRPRPTPHTGSSQTRNPTETTPDSGQNGGLREAPQPSSASLFSKVNAPRRMPPGSDLPVLWPARRRRSAARSLVLGDATLPAPLPAIGMAPTSCQQEALVGPARLTLQGRRAGECREPISNTPAGTMPFCNPTFRQNSSLALTHILAQAADLTFHGDARMTLTTYF